MNKKLLLNQNREFFDKLQLSNLNCKRLRDENQLLSEKIAILSEKITNLEMGLAKSNLEEEKTQQEKNSDDNFLKKTTTNNTEIEQDLPEVVLSEEIEYGSKIIGEIVMQASIFSNKLGAMDKQNKKELVNLILGRTEVAKAEILNIVSSDMSFAAKTNTIDSVCAEAVEYFTSVLEQ